MLVKAVRRKLRPGQPRKGSWHAKYTHRPESLPPRVRSFHQNSVVTPHVSPVPAIALSDVGVTSQPLQIMVCEVAWYI